MDYGRDRMHSMHVLWASCMGFLSGLHNNQYIYFNIYFNRDGPTFCERLGVPFEYNAVVKKWENIGIEDLRIEKGELLVVNSLYWFHYLLDETVVLNNPRDAVLKLIKNSNPSMFIHGVTNGQYSSPIFATRFKEALFHFTNMFDMMEATVPDEDEDRLIFEEHMLGKEAMNVIACEGTERVERPETYKHWQIRMQTKTAYHKNFCVDEGGMWLLLGWKHRVSEAMSCWQPADHMG